MSLKRKRDMSRIFRSRTLKFVIGKDQINHIGHESAFFALSPSFEDFVRRSTAIPVGIANERVNERDSSSLMFWPQIEPATFVNLMEYAYSIDYTVPALSKCKQNSTFNAAEEENGSDHTPNPASDDGKGNVNTPGDTTHARPSRAGSSTPLRLGTGAAVTRQNTQQPEISSLYMWIRSVSNDLQSQQHTSAQYRFCEEHFPIPSGATEATTEDWLEDVQQQHRTGYKEVFLAHAKLYLVANQFKIVELKRLCLHKLRQSLLYAPGTDEMLRAIAVTIQHVYSNTTSRDDDLRKLLLQFCLTDMEWMMRDKDLEPVLESVPGFAIDLFREIPHDYWRELRDGGPA
ncbi:hypothetical protein BDP55DRAFT_683282 [Colletotrichum godetiae]|uniref:BTB domain-containing protein n=1 Tax=Colletotrichum godetiae TaxID=1209918 RepID=A0AAJ0AAT5_9PEZI|nr:uncharacterized protein BDP55DRAFT_683282 [Colletotrichum godetiae]KAK1658177.1 hypothetical protein BDP55DRAFT_683282 [Colletotrichum godetiae]